LATIQLWDTTRSPATGRQADATVGQQILDHHRGLAAVHTALHDRFHHIAQGERLVIESLPGRRGNTEFAVGPVPATISPARLDP
jgi:hypothetical protein